MGRREPRLGLHWTVRSTVQVSATELRIYYFAEGTAGRFLCVAVSQTAGASWTKPALGLFEFNGSSANNIIAAGAPYGFLGSPDISAGTVFIDENPKTLESERFKMVMNWKKWLCTTTEVVMNIFVRAFLSIEGSFLFLKIDHIGR